MSARSQSLRRSAAILAAWWCAGGAAAQLASVSPFIPVQAAGVGAPTPGAPIEFRGTMDLGDGPQFRLVDTSHKNGAWVRLNEREPNLDVVVKQHAGDGDNETIVVEQQGRSFTLPLHTAKVVSSGAAGQGLAAPPPVQMPNMPAAVTQSVVVNPTPADEQRRLEAVAAEVARRRALRDQASQQVNQGQTAAAAQQVIQQQQQLQQQRQQNQPQGQPQPGQRGNGGNLRRSNSN